MLFRFLQRCLPSAPTQYRHRMPLKHIAAISLDLDDTLWPFLPAVLGAEQALHDWLLTNAPGTSRTLTTPQTLRELRIRFQEERPDLGHDMRALRLGSIRWALEHAEEDIALAEAAYDVFFAARQRVAFYEDALPALQWLSERYPLVAISNGNANLQVTGGHEYFKAAFSAQTFGSGKPEAAIFHAAAEAVGVAPERILHVGDDADLDVVGAMSAGMHAAWVVRAEAGATATPAKWERNTPAPHLIVSDLTALCRALELR